MIFVKPRQILNCGPYCSPLEAVFLEKPPRGGKRQRSSLSANINKRIRDGVIGKNRNATENRSRKASYINDCVPFALN